jgi:hypothetical protein
MKAAARLLVALLASDGAASGELRMLFVGNSLTETNERAPKSAARALGRAVRRPFS